MEMHPSEPTYPPRLVEVPGGRSADGRARGRDDVDAPDEELEAGGGADVHGADEPGDPEVRPEKVAEARLKILNGYYGRRDIQRKLAERLILELGG